MENFKIGDVVEYIGCSINQIRWGNNDDPREILIKGHKYYIESIKVHSQHTKLTLRGISGKFNSVCFEKK